MSDDSKDDIPVVPVPKNPLAEKKAKGERIWTQTSKQPLVWRCYNEECFESPLDRYYEFVRDEPKCPKCTLGPPVVTKRALVHLLVRDNRGPISGQYGLRYRIACDRTRREIATRTNGEAGTGDPVSVNCPGCMQSKEFKCHLTTGRGFTFR